MYVSIMGDSISTYEGFIPRDYALFYTPEKRELNDLKNVSDTWWMQVLDAMGASLLVNNSYSGSQVTGDDFPCASGPVRTSALGEDGACPDVVLVYIGVNDFGFAVPCDKSYADYPHAPNFYDAYRTMIRRIQASCPDTRVVCATILTPRMVDEPTWSFEEKWSGYTPLAEFNERIRQSAEETGALLADLESAAAGKLYDTRDGLHPDKNGHAQIAQLWIGELKRLGLIER